MPSNSGRRSFLFDMMLVPAAGAALAPRVLSGFHAARGTTQDPPDEEKFGETLDPPLVYKFVRGAHLNLDRTRDMLDAEPRLIRAAWEWGPGDFEMGIDGAAHTGSRDIVEFLIKHGAPYSAFAAATMGDLTTVKAMVEAQPSVAHATGAHEIPLIEHALAGGEAAAPVVAYLREQGAEPREGPKDLPTDASYRDAVIGLYLLDGQGQKLEFRIYAESEQLFIDAGRMGINRLLY